MRAPTLPANARIVALLTEEPDPTRAVVEVATEIAEERGRTLVLGVGVAGAALDEGLGIADSPGLAEVLSGKAKLTEVTHRAPERRFLYLPLGLSQTPPAGIGALIERVRAAGGTLLVVAPVDRGGLPAEWFDMELEIAGPDRTSRSASPKSMPGAAVESVPIPMETRQQDAALDDSAAKRSGPGDELPAVAMPAEAMPETGRWRRHRLQQRLPIRRLALAAAALIALLVGWWLLARIATRSSAVGSVPTPALSTEAFDEGVADGEGAESPEALADSSADGGDGPSAGAQRALTEAAGTGGVPELPYSVLVASYARSSDAFARARRISDGSILFFVVPTQVRGRIYHRLFAGALSTRDSARALMGELMGRGIKEAISSWDIRPAALGYLLSVHESPEEARTAERELLDADIWAYTIPLVAAGDTVYQVYAGAYERTEAAGALGEQLTEAGVNAELVPRRGEPR